MIRDQEKTMVAALASLLAQNQVDTKTISAALQIICETFEMECGVVYVIEDFSRYLLEGYYTSSAAIPPKYFPAEKIAMKKQSSTCRKDIFYVQRNEKNVQAEKYLLDSAHAESFAFMPMRYEEQEPFGFIVLFSAQNKMLDVEELKALTIPLYMLIHFMGARIYHNFMGKSQCALENILNNTGVDVYVNDLENHDILYVNQSMAAPYGGPEVFKGRKCWQVLFPGQKGPCDFCPKDKLVDEYGNPKGIYSWDYQRPFDGAWFRVFSVAFYWEDGRLAHLVSSADITENKRNEAMIENLANFDQLTKLPNRRMLIKECERCIDKAVEMEQGYVMFFDIDGFKSINDTFGHDTGDEFLIQLGEFFSSIPLLKDSIYRNGGDEFVALIGGEMVTKENIRTLTNFIHARFKKSWTLKKGEVTCNVSIGIACFPEDGSTAEALLAKADKAMYQVKKSGGAGVCFGYQLALLEDS